MKKFLSILALAVVFTACNNEGASENDPADSIEQRKDTLMSIADSAMQAQKDSLERVEQAIKARIDSTQEARKDSVSNTNKQ